LSGLSRCSTYLTTFLQATREANARAEALKARLEAAEAARLSQLISEDVRRKEELRAERAKQEREKEKEGRVEFLQVDSNGDRKLSMTLKVAEEEKEATVKLGLMSGGGEQRLEHSKSSSSHTDLLLPLQQTGSAGSSQ